MTYHKRITIDQAVMAGKPVITGTRIPVDLVLAKLARNIDVKTILHDYPRLTRQDIQAVFRYAHEIIAGEDVYPTA